MAAMNVTRLSTARRTRRKRSPAPHLRPVRPAAASATLGRAWINGREVGGTPPGAEHLGIGHD
jgi:hypothetical protein